MGTIVVIGTSHHNTYSMIRCFGECSIKPDLILYGDPDSYILRSIFINKVSVAKDAGEALCILKDSYTEGFVIACTDEIASLMDMSYDELNRHYTCFNCGSTGKLTHYMDKVVQSVVASQVGLKVPASIEANPKEVELFALPYPCIIKPLESIHGGKNIQICQSASEASFALKAFAPGSKVMIQQYVEKDYEIVVVGLSFKEEIHIPAYIQKHRDTKGGTTYSTVKSISELPSQIVTSCKRLVKQMSYQGLFGVELIRKDDDYFFIEINLRNDATTYSIAIAGCNLPMALWKLANGQSATKMFSNPIRQINAMVEYNDFIHVLKRNVSLLTWIKQRNSCECKYSYSKEDTRPYRKQKRDFVRFLFQMIYSHGIFRKNKDKITAL